jgi:hypothetical protein
LSRRLRAEHKQKQLRRCENISWFSPCMAFSNALFSPGLFMSL